MQNERDERIVDLLRNIAGLDDGNLYPSSHQVLVAAVKEWRTEAQTLIAILGWVNEDPSGQRREPSQIGWMGDISGTPFGPHDR